MQLKTKIILNTIFNQSSVSIIFTLIESIFLHIVDNFFFNIFNITDEQDYY